MPQPIPREWYYTTRNLGAAAATLTIPGGLSLNTGPSNIVHYLTHIEALELSVNGAAMRNISLQVFSGASVIHVWGVIDNAAQNGAAGSDAWTIDRDVSGLYTTPGALLTVQFDIAPTVLQAQYLAIRGYSAAA